MRQLCLIGLSIGISMTLIGQTGPGGFEETTSTSNLVLWLDASQLTGYLADQDVSIWQDLSGHAHHATQSTNSQQPTFKEAALNSNSVISFIQADDHYLSGNLANDLGQFNAPATVIALVKFDKASQTGASDNDYVFSIGSEGPIASNSGGEMTVIARRRNADGHQDKYYNYDGTDVDISDAAVLDDNSNWFIIVQILRETNSPDPYHSAFVDGSVVAYTTNSYQGPLATNGDYAIADWTLSSSFPGTDYYLDGDIAELMVYDKELNHSELSVIHAYLMAKWNGDTATDMDISSGDTFTDHYRGDLTAQGHYDFELIGIGQTSSTDKLSEASVSGLKVAISSNYGDGDFLMAAHNTTAIDLSTDGLTGDQQRWSRVWYVDVTDAGNVAKTTISFDISDAGLGGDFSGNATNYDLLYRETTAGSWSFLGETATYTDDQLQFIAVDLSGNGSAGGDGYYTLATSNKNLSPIGVSQAELGDKGPGGIEDTNGSSNLDLWLDANAIVANNGDLLNGWIDNSGNNANATQSSSSLQPEFDTDDSPNSMPSLLFDGFNDYLTGNLAANPTAPLTLVAVTNFAVLHQENGDFDNDYVISIGSTGNSNTEHLGISRRKDENGTGQGGSGGGQNQDLYYSWTGQTASFGPEIIGQQWNFISATHNTTTQRHEVYFDGVKQTSPSPDYTAGSIAATASDFNIGRWLGADNYMNGEIAEIILFDEVLNAAKLNILHSYLAAKYNIDFTISNGDRYIGDCAAVVAMTDCTVGHNYDFDVAGIGTEGSGGNQVSHTAASSAGMRMAMTASETSDSGVNDTFDGGDYIMFGHNQEQIQTTGLDIATTTSAIERRTTRTWFVDLTESDATDMKVDVTFDFSELGLEVFPAGAEANYKLLFRTDNTQGTEWTILAPATSISGDQVTFTDISFSADGFITLGSISESNSPLPVKLLYFEALLNDNTVNLEWSTADESGNYGFVVQRSPNGHDFEDLMFVQGSGDSNDISEYEELDNAPMDGNNYYRLKQVDFNGTFSYSEIDRVYVAPADINVLMVFPNPATDAINVQLPKTEMRQKLFVRDQLSRLLIEQDLDGNSTHLDVSSLNAGLYLLEARWGSIVQTKKILIKK